MGELFSLRLEACLAQKAAAHDLCDVLVVCVAPCLFPTAHKRVGRVCRTESLTPVHLLRM
jgi:hypothetical protein